MDGWFARDIEYLLAAQYAVESKQVSDEANIAMQPRTNVQRPLQDISRTLTLYST